MLNNGMGGIDWRGFDLAVEYFRVQNVEALIDGLLVVKGHDKKHDDDADVQE